MEGTCRRSCTTSRHLSGSALESGLSGAVGHLYSLSPLVCFVRVLRFLDA